MIIEIFPSGPFATNAFLIGSNGQAVIIDPAPESAPELIDAISRNGLTVQAIWLTHTHFDHIVDCKKLKDHYQVPVLVHALDAPNLREPGSDGLPMPFPFEGVDPDRLIEEGDILTVGHLFFRVIHTPGHTPGGVCLYDEKEKILISGDTLFKGSIGNLSLPTAEPEQMWSSLDKLAQLPPETRVYPGHGPATSIGAENWLPRAREIFGG